MSTAQPDIPFAELEGFAEVAGILAGHKRHHFDSVHSLCYHAAREDDLGNRWCDVELVLAEDEPPYARIGIRFHRVADVSFSFDRQIIGLFFQRVGERGWENIRYEVGDYEDSRIRLFCHDIILFAPEP